ncbi:unnamed protein product [Parascedosporium putredinis]|uniref:Uncharacterized protein n=1 Tax=Parascedosporium putredinis TaxID=1442378 RepID=A0A9P1H5Q7_9PEZI|nr:unnamed protein product [Parascedosporium putredinis]CAI7998055.1 unnamed protein product [Parascedosporium putredinis]
MDYSRPIRVDQRYTQGEMRELNPVRDTFFRMNREPVKRPMSVATEFVDTDWEEDGFLTDFEEPLPNSSHFDNSPRASLHSVGRGNNILTLSPITPSTVKDSNYLRAIDDSALHSPNTELASILAQTSRESMINAGVEFSVAQAFIDNDINGAILMTLKFEDLKELQIQSFGVRIKIWNQIQVLRDCKTASPLPPLQLRTFPAATSAKLPPIASTGAREACSKFRKQRRLIEAFKMEHPLATLDNGVLIAGNPGNPETANRIDTDDFRPVSDAVPSIVASSDIMGTGGLPALQYLRQATQSPETRLSGPSEASPEGHPFSEMDVPYISMPIDPLARDVSQSVPPDMNYRAPARSMSRASSRRPSFPVMPAVDENRATAPLRQGSKTPSPTLRSEQKPLRAPPRVNYPWSPIERTKPFETAIPPFPTMVSHAMPVKEAVRSNTMDGTTYQGPMKKRKTHFLRHEWQDGYFTLKGTRLAMHKDAQEIDRTLEYVDIDDYAIACSSYASQSKLSAALKTMHIRQGKTDKADVAAFAFQLVPQDKQHMGRLKKRESVQPSNPIEGTNGTGKTHHFAVKGREERIDWMRELMLAKALKQKGEGFQISVNGSMI